MKFTYTFIFVLIILLLVCCKTDNEKVSLDKQKLDSIRMYAYDSLYFGTKEGEHLQIDFFVNNVKYRIQEGNSYRGKMNYYMIATDSLYQTEEESKTLLNELKDKITAEDNRFRLINKYEFIEHPSNRKTIVDSIGIESSYKYDKDLIGLPYKYKGCTWNLAYRELEIGYFIKYNKKNLKKASYKVYFKMRSKVIKNKTSR